LDLLRIVGVAAVVLQHTWTDDLWGPRLLSTWDVALFFVLTGYLWAPGRTVRAELDRRTRTLLVPYAAWLLLVAAIWYAVLASQGHAFTEPIGDLILGGWYLVRPWSAFWFITALFVACVFMRSLERFPPFVVWAVGSAGVLWAWLDPTTLRALPLAIGQGVAAVFFLCVGRLLAEHRHRVRRPVVVGLLWAAPAFLVGAAGVTPRMDLKAGVLEGPATVLVACAIACGAILIAERLGERIPPAGGRAILSAATLALPVILGHALVLTILEWRGVPQSIWLAVAATAMPAAFGWLMARTRLRTVLLGLPPRNRRRNPVR
jgi:hypothetical protein